MKSLRSLLLLLCCTTFAFGRDRNFRGVVNAIEHRYGVHPASEVGHVLCSS